MTDFAKGLAVIDGMKALAAWEGSFDARIARLEKDVRRIRAMAGSMDRAEDFARAIEQAIEAAKFSRAAIRQAIEAGAA